MPEPSLMIQPGHIWGDLKQRAKKRLLLAKRCQQGSKAAARERGGTKIIGNDG